MDARLGRAAFCSRCFPSTFRPCFSFVISCLPKPPNAESRFLVVVSFYAQISCLCWAGSEEPSASQLRWT